MKTRFKLLVVFGIVFSTLAVAQQNEGTAKKAPVKPKPIPVYLGHSDYSSGPISKSVFDGLLDRGLTSKDSTGKVYNVDGFLLTFAERNLYEDSTGQMMIQTDYLSEICFNDTLSTFLKGVLKERAKKGDTIIFDQTTVRTADGKTAHGRPMKLVIQK